MNKKINGIKLFDLTGKTAIITGGSKGLGFAMAEGLASAGANVMLVNRNKAEGQGAAAKIQEVYGTKAIAFAADISDEAQTLEMANLPFRNSVKLTFSLTMQALVLEVQLMKFPQQILSGSWTLMSQEFGYVLRR